MLILILSVLTWRGKPAEGALVGQKLPTVPSHQGLSSACPGDSPPRARSAVCVCLAIQAGDKCRDLGSAGFIAVHLGKGEQPEFILPGMEQAESREDLAASGNPHPL